jgi:hypothetical protein
MLLSHNLVNRGFCSRSLPSFHSLRAHAVTDAQLRARKRLLRTFPVSLLRHLRHRRTPAPVSGGKDGSKSARPPLLTTLKSSPPLPSRPRRGSRVNQHAPRDERLYCRSPICSSTLNPLPSAQSVDPTSPGSTSGSTAETGSHDGAMHHIPSAKGTSLTAQRWRGRQIRQTQRGSCA